MESATLREKINRKLIQDLDEFEVIARFLTYLNKEEKGAAFRVADVDVISADGRRNADFLLEDSRSHQKVAVELTMLYESESIFQARQAMSGFVRTLRSKLATLHVRHFYYLQVPINADLPEGWEIIAGEVVRAVRSLVEQKVNKCVTFKVDNIDFRLCVDESKTGDEVVHVFPVLTEYAPSEEFSGRLIKALEDKNQQLSVEGVDRRMLVITDQFLVKGGCGFAAMQLSRIDFSPYENIGEIYYESGTPGDFCLVYKK